MKILATSAMGIMTLTMPFALTGCDKDSDINVRVDGDYIQWQLEGEDSWTNLLSVEEVKDLLGESYKGDTGAQGPQGVQGEQGQKGDKGEQGLQGNPGINGREVEFRKSATHIQWRYVDDSQTEDENWANLISLSELKGNPGQAGSNGTNGKTPFIGTNGNWWIGVTDTGVKAEGQDGHTPTIEISSDGYWVIDGIKQSVKAVGEKGDPGTQGSSGVDGREVEFRTTETHIQWRYVDSNQSEDQNWDNLVSFEEMRKEPENPNQEAINQAGFELFSTMMSELFSFNSEYKIIYEFRNHSETENYFQGSGSDYVVESNNPSGLYSWSCVTSNTGKLYVDEAGLIYQVYKLSLVGNPEGNGNFVPTKKIDAEYAEAYRLIGVAYLQLKQNAEACEYFSKAKELGDTNVETLIEKYCK